MANLSKSIDTRKRVSEILESGVISEKDLNLLKSRLNRKFCNYYDVAPLYNIALNGESAAKGVNWLRNLYKLPSGKIRKNNPFGAREISVLEGENVKIRFVRFYFSDQRGTRYYQPNY